MVYLCHDDTEQRTVDNASSANQRYCWIFRSQQVDTGIVDSSAVFYNFQDIISTFQQSSGTCTIHVEQTGQFQVEKGFVFGL